MTPPNLKPLVFLVGTMPLVWLGCRYVGGELGFNPIEAANRFLGDWALRLLLVTLSLSPLFRVTGWRAPVELRRLVGVFAFAYAMLHIASYLALDLGFDWRIFAADIVKRRYITLGMASFLLMLPLALTSLDVAIRRLGLARWRHLHRLVFPCAGFAVAHHWLMVKADIRTPLFHAAILTVLIVFRLMSGRAEKTPARVP